MLKGYEKHKDATPIETISKIRNILSDLGILIIEVEWKNSYNCYFSVRVITDIFGYRVGTNGKGITAEYALASAYSEFMERLQNLLLIKRQYGLMKDTALCFPDSKRMSKPETIQSARKILSIITKGKEDNLLFEYDDKILSHSYYNVNTNEVCFLPDSVLGMTGSNGMCAGNTPQEAITQGLCEILERYSVNYIYKNNISVPTIDITDIVSMDIFKYVKIIQNAGYSVLIKDCTLSGKIPVLATVIFNKDYSKVLVKFGSDTNFEIALMRCLSEAFQGVSNRNLESKMISIDLIEEKATISSNKCPDDFWETKFIFDFIKSDGQPNYKSAFESEFKNSQQSLNFLLDILVTQGHYIYIKDVSFLGYPSYHVYIPHLSELYGYDYAYSFSGALNIIKPILLNLANKKTDEISSCIHAIETFLNNPLRHFVYTDDKGRFIKDFTSINLKAESDFYTFNLEYLLSLLHLRIESYEKAAYYLNLHLKMLKENNISIGNIAYYKCALYYIKMKSKNVNIDIIVSTLGDIFGNSVTAEVIQDIRYPENTFSYFKLPNCGDCLCCNSNDECYYNEWKNMASVLNAKLEQNPINQNDLSKFIQLQSITTDL